MKINWQRFLATAALGWLLASIPVLLLGLTLNFGGVVGAFVGALIAEKVFYS